MRILGSVVAPLTALVAFCDPKLTGCSSIRSQVICDKLVWHKPIFLQKLAHECHLRPFVPFRLDQYIEDLALGVDGAPQIDHAAIDFQIDFVKMPSRIGFGSAFAQVRRDHRSEVVPPAPDSFVGHHDTAFRQQIFDVAKAQGKPDVKPDRLLDDFQREPVPLVADFLHPPGYLTASEAASPNRRDKAVAANVHDLQGGRRVLTRLSKFLGGRRLKRIYADGAYVAKSFGVWVKNKFHAVV